MKTVVKIIIKNKQFDSLLHNLEILALELVIWLKYPQLGV